MTINLKNNATKRRQFYIYKFIYMTDATFRNINRLFAFSIKIGNNNLARLCFGKCHISTVGIKYLNILTDNESSFYQRVKNKQETYENSVEMSKNDDYTTKNLLDYLYYETYYKFTGIDLSRQTNKSISQ